MANAFTLWGELRADTSQFEASMRKAEGRLDKTEAAMQGSATAARNLVKWLASAGTAYAALSVAKAAVDRATAQSRANRLLSASATEAGISVDQLAAKNVAFAKATGLSTVAAAQTTSNIARLATGAGMTGKLDQLLQSFADLGAARGIAGEELNSLIGTILSGQDEGLNRLGIADPGKLYEAYAKSVGRSVESLSQQEKVQAAVNAVMDKAAIFTGAAEDRMNSFDGQVAKVTSQYENFLDVLAQSAITSGPVTDFFNELSRAINGVAISTTDVRKKLQAGMTPDAIAKEMRPSPTIGDWVSGLASSAIAPYLVGYDIATSGIETANRNLASATPWGTYQRRLGEDAGRIAAEKRQMDKQAADAYQQRVADSTRTYEAMMKSIMEEARGKEFQKQQAEREKFLEQSLQSETTKLANTYSIREALLKDHLSATKSSEIQSIQATTNLKNKQIAAQLQLEKSYYKALLANANPEDVAGLQIRMATAVSNAQTEMRVNSINAMTAIREQMKQLKSEISAIFVSGFQDNPFVQIFDSGRLAIERVKQATAGLNPVLQEMLLTLQQGSNAAAVFGQVLENRLTSSNLRNEARQFAQGRLDADTPQNFQDNLDRQLRAVGALGKSFGLTADERRLIDKQIISLTQGLDPAKLTSTQNLTAAAAREREAKRLDAQQKKAAEVQEQLKNVLDSLDKSIRSGTIIEIRNKAPENATVSRGSAASVRARY